MGCTVRLGQFTFLWIAKDRIPIRDFAVRYRSWMIAVWCCTYDGVIVFMSVSQDSCVLRRSSCWNCRLSPAAILGLQLGSGSGCKALARDRPLGLRGWSFLQLVVALFLVQYLNSLHFWNVLGKLWFDLPMGYFLATNPYHVPWNQI